MQRLPRLLIASGTATAAIAGSGVVDVAATNWYGATGSTSWCNGNMQDNSTMTWHRGVGLSTDFRTAIVNNNNGQVNPTDLVVNAETASPDGNTDVLFTETNHDGYQATCGDKKMYWHGSVDVPAGSTTVIAWTKCQSLSGSKCQQFDVFFDASWDSGRSYLEVLRLTCHETGHSLGLTHGSITSCMNTLGVYNYSDHEVKDHINANY